MPAGRTKPRRAVALVAAGVTLTAGSLAALAPVTATASSHREAPAISEEPPYDNTDLYAFVSPDKPDSVTIIANWYPFEEPAGGPNFYPFADDAVHNIHIDNDGDARPDLTYRFTFNSRYRNPNTFLYNTGPVTNIHDRDLNFVQNYRLQLLDRDGKMMREFTRSGPVAPSFVGAASMPSYSRLRSQAVMNFAGGVKAYAGQADDPFFLDLRVFDLIYGGNLSEVGNDTLAGYNTNTIALQVPRSALTRKGDPVIGVWSTTARQRANGTETQISRLGNPLVNEVVIPVKDKDKFNRSLPKGDAQFGKYVTNPELPKILNKLYKLPVPAEPRNDLVAVFLTGVDKLNKPKNVTPSEQLRLNTSIPPTKRENRLGVIGGDVAGFPNGRRLRDDVVDIALQVTEGELLGMKNNLGDAVNRNDKEFTGMFPYVAVPHSGSKPRPAPRSTGATLLTGGNSPNGGPGAGGLPVLPLSGVALGLLAAAGGVALSRRSRPVSVRVTA